MCQRPSISFGEVRDTKRRRFVGPPRGRRIRPPAVGTLRDVTAITSVRLPIDWTDLAWPEIPVLGSIALSTGDPEWAWTPAAPAFPIRTHEPPSGTEVEAFTVDHVVLLVPSLDAAIETLERVDLAPRLRMQVSGRPAAFFRVGTVLEVIESPVRQPSLYGIALSTDSSLESIALEWRALGVEVGDIKPAIQPGRRIVTIHGMDAGLAVMSADRAVEPRR